MQNNNNVKEKSDINEQERQEETLGWAEGMAQKREESSQGWAEGLAEEPQEGETLGWAEGMARKRERDSEGWAEGFIDEASGLVRLPLLLGKQINGNPIVDVIRGHIIGRTRDIYLDREISRVLGVYLGTEGLLSRTGRFIDRQYFEVVGRDVILVQGEATVEKDDESPRTADWLRRDDLHGREIVTEGGTRIGRVGDVILDHNAHVVGFVLGRTFVEGPIAENRVLSRTCVLDMGNDDAPIVIDLNQAEQQQWKLIEDSIVMTEATAVAEA